MKKILGVDEAGRGCVIGPMVLCGFLAEEDKIEKLKELKVKDSKKLSPKKRGEMFREIELLAFDIEVIKISPAEIDKHSLNKLGLEATIEMLKKLQPDELYYDAPTHGKGLIEYADLFKSYLPDTSKVIVENKADDTYPIVSAASIIAKVTRDSIIHSYYERYGNFGSGYSSDPKTIVFLEKWYEKYRDFPEIVRTKWKTIDNIKSKQLKLF